MTRFSLFLTLFLTGGAHTHAQLQQPSAAQWNDMLIRGCKAAINNFPEGSSQPTDTMNGGYCMGYIQGIEDSLHMMSPEANSLCIPDGVNTGQLIKVFLKYTDDHPEKLHLDSLVLVLAALKNAFPCPK